MSVAACGNFNGAPPPEAAPDGGVAPADGGEDAPADVVPIAETFAVTAPASTAWIIQGEDVSIPVKVTRGSITDALTVRVDGLRTGVIATPLTIPPGSSEGTLTIAAAPEAVQGDLAATVVATAQGASTSAALPLFVRGKPGAIDTTFGKDGIVSSVFPSGAPLSWELLVTSDDGLVAFSGAQIARFAKDGKPDPAFTPPALAWPGDSAALQPDGKILVAGTAGSGAIVVARFLPNGAFDATFGSGGTATIVAAPGTGAGTVAGLSVRADGAIAVVLQSDTSVVVKGVAANGALAPALDTTTQLGASFVAADGSVVGSGFRSSTSDKLWIAFAEASAYGFAVGNDFPQSWSHAGIQSSNEGAFRPGGVVTTDGSLVTAWALSDSAFFVSKASLVTGAADAAFGAAGVAGPFTPPTSSPGISAPTGIVQDAKGNILVSLYTAEQIARLTPDGKLDTSFGDQGWISTPDPTSSDHAVRVRLQSDGRIVALTRVTIGAGGDHDDYLKRYWN